MMIPKLREPTKIDELRECFKVFDKDGNGVITVNDLASLFSRLEQRFTKQEIADMLKAADSDGDRRVTFDGW